MTAAHKIMVNRAPVMTLWATVVAERLGYDRATALTLGKTVAGMNAQSKGQRLGIFEESDRSNQEEQGAAQNNPERADRPTPDRQTVKLLGRDVPVVATRQGLRAVGDGRTVSPDSVTIYLQQKFGEQLTAVEAAMQALAASYPPEELARQAYTLYEHFRPVIPEGAKGWGAKGELDLNQLHQLARR